MSTSESHRRIGASTLLSAAAVLTAAACVVLVATHAPLALATGAVSIALTGFAGIISPRSTAAPKAFLVCCAFVLVAALISWMHS